MSPKRISLSFMAMKVNSNRESGVHQIPPPKYNGFIPLSASFVNSARWLYEKCCRKMPYSAVIKKKKRGFLFGMRIFDRITAKI